MVVLLYLHWALNEENNMENNAPTAAGPTPDSEDNNNGSEKESPSPRIIESTTTENLAENEGVKNEHTTPDSAVDGVTNEASDEVTIESKPPEANENASPEERVNLELGEETMGNEEETQRDKEEETQGDIANEDNGGADESKGEKPPETHTETDVRVEETEVAGVTSESKVEAESEEPAVVEDKEKGDVPLDLVTETNVTESEPEPEGDSRDQAKEENVEPKQDFETNVEGEGDESQEDSQQEHIDTSSSVTKIEEGYSADNEATATLASIDTGEPSQSGSVFEKDGPEVESTEISGDRSNSEEKIGGEADKKNREEQEKEEPPMNYEELVTKYHATELQLDGLRDENRELEDKIRNLERQIKEFNEGREQDKLKQRDGYMVQADFLARELSQTQDAEKFLKEKVAELLEEKEESEKKVRDLQLRLKRFSKDDKVKDERIAKMESELKEITEEVQELETYLDEETKVKIRAKRSSTRGSTVSAGNSHTKVTDMNKMNTNRSHRDPEPVQRSRTCTII